MKRRDFLLTSVLSAVGLSLPACKQSPVSGNSNHASYSNFELSEATIQELQEKLQSGELTSEQIVRLYLNRIKQLDKDGPMLNAIIEVNGDAVHIARQLDEERSLGKVRGPLHGIPVLLKENIDTADQMITSAGSLALANHRAGKDAFIVTQLRAAGAVILGKTNLSEWANFRSTNSSSGWSSRGGQTRNPYVLDRTPCGSSSGSAVAVAANLAPLAVGTETDGSIVCPSGINGIVGIKPTVGLLSRSGIIPISESQDTAGPMARTVRDAALLLTVMAGEDQADAATAKRPGQTNIYLNFDDNVLSGARIGYLSEMVAFDKRVASLMNEVVVALEGKGADVIEIGLPSSVKELGQYEWTVLLCEFKDGIERYLRAHPACGFQSLKELIEYNELNSDKLMPWFEQEVFEAANATKGLDDPKYVEAKKKCKELSQTKGIDQLMADYKLDALMGPTNGPAWCIDYVNGDNFGGGSSQLAAVAGYPSITVPAGAIKGLPIGVSFFGLPWTESRLIQIAHLYEKISHNRLVPTFIKQLTVEDLAIKPS